MEGYVAPALCLYIKNGVKDTPDTYLVKIHFVVHEILSVLYFSLFLVADDSNFGWSICENFLIHSQNHTSDTVLALIHSEALQNCHFMFLLFLVTAASSQLPSPSGIFLKGFYLQIILIESG